MNIAIIGTGNIGSTLGLHWSQKGHRLFIGVRDPNHFKGQALLQQPNTSLHSIQEAVQLADVVVLAIPAPMAVEVTQSLGDTTGKIIIDAMNIVRGRSPVGFSTTTEAILAHTQTRDVVKCFNTTGFNNMQDPIYKGTSIDLFVAGDSSSGTAAAQQLAHDAGFENCYSIGGNDKFSMMEEFARFWINLAMFQGMGRDIGFKLMKR